MATYSDRAAIATTSLFAAGSEADEDSRGTVTSFSPAIKSSINTVTSANYAILDDDGYNTILVDGGTSDRTITMPNEANNEGRVITIRRIDAPASGSPSIIINDFSASLITKIANRKSSSYTGQNLYITLHCDGSTWETIGTSDMLHDDSTVSWATSAANANSLVVPPGTWSFYLHSYRSAGSADTQISVSLSTTSATHNSALGQRFYGAFLGSVTFMTVNHTVTKVVTTETTFYHVFNTGDITGGTTGNHMMQAIRLK